MKGPIGCCLGIQMIVLIVVVVFIFGQQEELMERDEAINALSFVNDCGDKYTKIPDYFLPQIEEAYGKIIFVAVAAIVQVVMIFATIIVCVFAGTPDDDDSDNDYDYDKVPEDD